jgi:hypothetical protein
LDSVCCRAFLAFSTAGIRFESHLGHDVFPRQRRLLRRVYKACGRVALDGWVAGCAWPPRACSGVWGAGSSPWPVGPSACCGWVYAVLVPVLSGGPGWPTPIHAPGEREQHDFSDLATGPDREAVLGVHTSVSRRVLSCQRGCGQCPHLRLLCLIAGRKTDVAILGLLAVHGVLTAQESRLAAGGKTPAKSALGGEERAMTDGQ